MAIMYPRRRLSRKGFVFTSIATVVVIVIVVFALAERRSLDRTLTQTSRVHTMDVYLENLEADLPRAAYIASFRSLIAMEEHISETGTYLNDTDQPFAESFTNGSINGTPYGIMDNSTFTEFTQRFDAIAQRQGLDAELTVTNLTVLQTDPWSITVQVTIFVNLSDTANTARFTRAIDVTTDVPVLDIKDPLYSVGTQGRAPHPVRRGNVSAPYISVTNDTSRLQALVNNTWYIESTDAPSFLGRFRGNLSASPYGIQSIVNIPELTAQDLPIEPCASTVDFRYFSGNTETTYAVVNMDQTEFWLGASDLATYDATGKTVGTVCP